MPNKFINKFIYLFVLVLLFSLLYPSETKAGLATCNVESVSPQNVSGGVSSQIVFNILNNDENSNLLHYLKLKSQTSNIDFESADGPNFGGYSISDDKTEIMINTTLSVGESGQFAVNVNATGGVTESSSFLVYASSESDGQGVVQCSGEASFSITSSSADSISISDISISSGESSATITWNSNYQTLGLINYGTSTNYGSSVSETTYSQRHSLTLNNLSSETQYNFKILNTDMSNNTISTNNKTFVTTKKGEDVVVTNTVTKDVLVTKIIEDKTKPLVKFKTNFSKYYTEAPTIEFSVSDNVGVSRVEYSVDSGNNWYQVDLKKNLGKKDIVMRVNPEIYEDDDYVFLIRAFDTTGNEYTTKSIKIVIDRLPPNPGALTVSMGSLNINIDSSGYMPLIPNVEYKFITTFSGGPSNAQFICGDDHFDFIKSDNSSFWSAKYKFSKLTSCEIKIMSEDGAGNSNEKKFFKINVLKNGLTNANNIKVYVFDNILNKFVLWNASIYNQNNPLFPSDSYSLILPKGKYYLESTYSPLIREYSELIEVNDLAVINSDWLLYEKFDFKKFFGITQHNLSPVNINANNWLDSSIQTSLKSKNMIVSYVTSWSADTLKYLEEIQKIKDNKIEQLVIFVHEPKTVADYYIKRSKFNFNYLADPDGEYIKEFSLSNYPTTVIVDNNGRVKKIKTGFIDFEELKNKYYESVY